MKFKIEVYSVGDDYWQLDEVKFCRSRHWIAKYKAALRARYEGDEFKFRVYSAAA